MNLAIIAEALAALDSPAAGGIAHLKPGLRSYLADRIETGGFLRCVLENNLSGAVLRADQWLTMAQMKALLELLNTSFPVMAWVSPEKVAAWLAEGEEGGADAGSK